MKTITINFLLLVMFLSSGLLFSQTQIPFKQKPKNALNKKNIGQMHTNSVEITKSRNKTLPFFENWDSGTFATNSWHFNNQSDNWVIRAHAGNPEPSAEFTWDPLLENNYTSTLTSDSILADILSEGYIYFDFDIKLDDRNSTGDEKMSVEVYNDSIWIRVAEFINNGSFVFVSNHIDISEYVLGNVFSIRFNVTGQNSFDIQSWFVDNISVYRECKAPLYLTGEYIWFAYDDYGAEICWEKYVAPIPEQWFYYDDESIEYVWGDNSEPWEADIAIKIDADDLIDFEGAAVTRYHAFVDGRLLGTGTVSVKVYQGENPDPTAPLYEEDVTDQFITGDDWNDFVFSQAVLIDHTQDLWLGMYLTGQADTYGPGITADMGYYDPNGDLIWDTNEWDHLLAYGISNRAWLLRGYVTVNYDSKMALGNDNLLPMYKNMEMAHEGSLSKAKTSQTVVDCGIERSLTYFNVYRSIDYQGNYELIANVNAEEGIISYCYYDKDIDVMEFNCWQVTAIYEGSNDICESTPALSYNIPMDNFVCAFISSSYEPLSLKSNIYPNPAQDMATIKSSVPINHITVTNYVGQIVYSEGSNKAVNIELNTSSYQAGVYLVTIHTENSIITKQLVISR